MDGVIQGYAVEELHHHEGAAVFLSDVMNDADVGVVQGGTACASHRERSNACRSPPTRLN
jgi:hypothetical protein